jgi:hypothetical protein
MFCGGNLLHEWSNDIKTHGSSHQKHEFTFLSSHVTWSKGQKGLWKTHYYKVQEHFQSNVIKFGLHSQT